MSSSDRVAAQAIPPADDAVARLYAELAELRKRVHALEDERELRDLLTRYSFGADVYRGPDWVRLFTPDGQYELGTDNVEGAYNGSFAGADELLALITGPGMPAEGRSQHHHGPMVFRVDGDGASAESYSITYLLGDDGATRVFCAGFSRWSFQRVDGRWRITERHRRELGADDVAALIGAPDAR
ncbi:MAG: hypothetical protein QOE61_3635 [Micromonosporaceae bacterium]|jgi:hypothetical protein|nr:hypothetical protein [Micromonosporaceae bacterium]